MDLSLVVRRDSRRTQGVLNPDDEAGDVVDVFAAGTDHGTDTRARFAIVEMPDWPGTLAEAHQFFCGSDWPAGLVDIEQVYPLRQRSLQVDAAALGPMLTPEMEDRLQFAFTVGADTRPADWPFVAWDTLRQALRVKRDPTLRVQADRTLERSP